jgi:hypothetical protein
VEGGQRRARTCAQDGVRHVLRGDHAHAADGLRGAPAVSTPCHQLVERAHRVSRFWAARRSQQDVERRRLREQAVVHAVLLGKKTEAVRTTRCVGFRASEVLGVTPRAALPCCVTD